jgi:NAD(P)-dependent dehydrogenase (short-subunit alcohol dehydrogenase family)
MKAVKAAAESFMAHETRLDILINNAGLLARPLDKDLDGISVSMSTNHLAPFILTTTLLPLLKSTSEIYPGVRVIMVSSTTHTLPPPGVRLNSLDAWNAELGGIDGMPSNLVRYGLSKLANILVAKKLQRIFEAESIDAIALSLHPGGVRTTGSINFVGEANLSMLDNALDPIDGANTSLFASTSSRVWREKETFGGAYLMPFGVVEEPSENARNEDLVEELWETSKSIANKVLMPMPPRPGTL